MKPRTEEYLRRLYGRLWNSKPKLPPKKAIPGRFDHYDKFDESIDQWLAIGSKRPQKNLRVRRCLHPLTQRHLTPIIPDYFKTAISEDNCNSL